MATENDRASGSHVGRPAPRRPADRPPARHRSVRTVNPLLEHEIEIVDSDRFGKALVCRVPVPSSTVVFSYRDLDRIAEQTAYTIQVSPAEHVYDPHYLSYLNHSCAPNLSVSQSAQAFVALRDIAPGEELTYFYPSTETNIAVPFTCNCGSSTCIGIVRGSNASRPAHNEG